MSAASKQKSIAEEDAACCAAAEKFATIYYEAFDKRRHMVGNMYTDGAVMVWNGQPLNGQPQIADFVKTLPVSEHTIQSLDAHTVQESATAADQKMMVLLSAGNVQYDGRLRAFTQTLILTATDGDVWKITSDRVRFID